MSLIREGYRVQLEVHVVCELLMIPLGGVCACTGIHKAKPACSRSQGRIFEHAAQSNSLFQGVALSFRIDLSISSPQCSTVCKWQALKFGMSYLKRVSPQKRTKPRPRIMTEASEPQATLAY